MGNDLAKEEIRGFLFRLSQKYTQPVKLYLLGGSALSNMGSPRWTVDIDSTAKTTRKNLSKLIPPKMGGSFINFPKFSLYIST